MEGGEVTCGILPQSRTENGRAGAYAPVFFAARGATALQTFFLPYQILITLLFARAVSRCRRRHT